MHVILKIFILVLKKDLKNVAMPRAEKLKKYIKEIFEAEAKDYQQRQVED